MSDILELTAAALKAAIPASQHRRLMNGKFESGSDISALRRFVGLSQPRFATALGISVHTLRNWEQDRRRSGTAADRSETPTDHPREPGASGLDGAQSGNPRRPRFSATCPRQACLVNRRVVSIDGVAQARCVPTDLLDRFRDLLGVPMVTEQQMMR